MALDSYNSTYPTEYYEIGTCYSFYKKTNIDNKRPATKEEITKYADALEKCFSENRRLMTAGESYYCKDIARAVGIVIGTSPIVGNKDFHKALDVMFMASDGSYFITRYGIEGTDVRLNGNESIIPGKVVPGKLSPPDTTYKPVPPTTGDAAPVSGPTEVKKSGPTEAKKSGPTEAKKSGPTEVVG